MKKEAFEIQIVVRNKENGKIGVVCKDLPGPMRCCGPDEIPVVYHGETSFLGTDFHNLEIIGPENATPHMEKCGAGRGAECCIFLTAGQNELYCERFGDLRWQLILNASKMVAQRHPEKPFPACQLA